MAFMPLMPVHTVSATDTAETYANIYKSLQRPHPKLHMLPEFGKSKGDTPIALVAGGPSLHEFVQELRCWKAPIVAVGSCHDFLVNHAMVIPRYAVICDPEASITPLYCQHPNPLTTYLVATQCNESVFKALDGQAIALWHCIANEVNPFLDAVDPGYHGVGGGCTTGLRALSIAICLGYKNIHFYGYDSCIRGEDEPTHAYPMQTDREDLGKIYEIRCKKTPDDPDETTYRCAGYQLAQAQHFEAFLRSYGGKFTAHFHGGGLMSAVHRMVMG